MRLLPYGQLLTSVCLLPFYRSRIYQGLVLNEPLSDKMTRIVIKIIFIRRSYKLGDDKVGCLNLQKKTVFYNCGEVFLARGDPTIANTDSD